MNRISLAILLLLGAGPAVGVADDEAPAEQAQPAKPAKAAKPGAKVPRLRLFVNGVSTVSSVDFAQSRTFRQYAEDGRVESEYSSGSGLGFEVGLHYRFNPRLGAMLSFATASRDGTLSYSATVPHPLYLDRARTASGTQEGLSHGETAIHLDFVYQVQSGGFELLFFAGPSRVELKTDVLSRLDYRETYPFDVLSVAGVDLTEVSDSGLGVNFGAGVDYRFGKSRTFAIGAQIRYTTASATVAPPEGPTIDVTTGGFQAAVGLRVSF